MHLSYLSPTNNKEDKYWIKELNLYETDRKSLDSGEWLNDAVIKASQDLLKERYTDVDGLQSPALGPILQFHVQRTKFVQILHIMGNHWVTVSNIRCCEPATIQVFDSMRNQDLPSQAISQIAAIMWVEKPNIVLEFVPVQKQDGDSDCGLFAIAFATSLCAGNNPAEYAYIQDKLRNHLRQCLENRKVTEFPSQPRKIKQLCNPVRNMVQCDQCQEWFHDECVTVPDVVRNGDNISWLCKACKK